MLSTVGVRFVTFWRVAICFDCVHGLVCGHAQSFGSAFYAHLVMMTTRKKMETCAVSSLFFHCRFSGVCLAYDLHRFRFHCDDCVNDGAFGLLSLP